MIFQLLFLSICVSLYDLRRGRVPNWFTLPLLALRLFATFFATGLLQVALRKSMRQPLTGIRSPGAWRTIHFLLWSFYAH